MNSVPDKQTVERTVDILATIFYTASSPAPAPSPPPSGRAITTNATQPRKPTTSYAGISTATKLQSRVDAVLNSISLCDTKIIQTTSNASSEEEDRTKSHIEQFDRFLKERAEVLRKEILVLQKSLNVPSLTSFTSQPRAPLNSPRLPSSRTTTVKIGARRHPLEVSTPLLDCEFQTIADYLEKQRAVLATLRCESEVNEKNPTGKRQRSLSKGFLVVTLRLEEPKPREWQHSASQSAPSSTITERAVITKQASVDGRRWEQKPAAPTSGVADDVDAAFEYNKGYSKLQTQKRYSSMRVKSQLAAIWNENKEDEIADSWSDDDDDDIEDASSAPSTPPIEYQRNHSESMIADSRKINADGDSTKQPYFSRKITFSQKLSPSAPLPSPTEQPSIVWQKLAPSPSDEVEKRKEEFRKNLFGGWDSEIAAMDTEKARWFLERMETERADRLMEQLGNRPRARKDSNPTPITSFVAKQPTLTKSTSVRNVNGLLGRAKQKISMKKDKEKVEKDRKCKIIAKQFRETRGRLEKYRNVIQKNISNQEVNYKMLKAQEVQLLQDIKGEIEKFSQWANPNLVKCYRKFALAKLAILDAQLRRAKIKLALAKFKLDVANDDIQTLRDGLPLVFTADYFKDPEAMTNHDIEYLTHLEKILEITKKGLGRAFIRARSKAVVDDRVARLKSIIDSTALDGSNMYHAYHEIMQNEFNFFLLDSRYVEGNKIQRLCEALSNATQRIPAEEIINFLEDFVNELADQNKFQIPEETTKLRIFVYRAVFPRIFSYCFVPLRNDPQNKENNKRFAQQVQWLRKLTPSDIDVDLEKYWKLVNIPYDGGLQHPFSRAWELLEYLPYELVPTDMLLIVRDVVILINEIGRDITNSVLSTDDMFPILLYVTIHAEVHNIFEHLEYMEAYASPCDRMGQLGFCLTTLSAACNHILNLKPSDLHKH